MFHSPFELFCKMTVLKKWKKEFCKKKKIGVRLVNIKIETDFLASKNPILGISSKNLKLNWNRVQTEFAAFLNIHFKASQLIDSVGRWRIFVRKKRTHEWIWWETHGAWTILSSIRKSSEPTDSYWLKIHIWP